MSYAVPPPVERLFSVTRHCDLAFTIRRVDGGVPVDIAEGTTVAMYIDIDRADPTKVDAVISGSDADFVIDAAVIAAARTGTRLQVVIDGNVDTPLLVGRIERHDG